MRLLFLMGLLWNPQPTARGAMGTLETLDGHTYQGFIRLESNSVHLVNAAERLSIVVPLTNVLELTLEKPPQPATPLTNRDTLRLERPLPEPWRSEDVGATKIAGSATFDLGIFRIRGMGTNLLNERDSCHFVYRPVKGNSEIVARVVGVPLTDAQAKAGVMMRESLAADAPNVMLAVNAARHGSLLWRETKGTATIVAPQRDLSPPHWIKLKRDGDSFAAYKSRNGHKWWLVDRITIPMKEEIYVGLAASSGHPERMICAMVDNVREAPSLPITSFVPRVELISGTVLPGPIKSVNSDQIHFESTLVQAPVSAQQVARLLFQWLPYRYSWKVSSGQPGVLLATGDFVEGDVLSLDNSYLRISSVLYGIRRFDINSEVIAAIWRPARKPSPAFEIRTTRGAVWLVDRVATRWNELLAYEPSLGEQGFALGELAEIRRRK